MKRKTRQIVVIIAALLLFLTITVIALPTKPSIYPSDNSKTAENSAVDGTGQAAGENPDTSASDGSDSSADQNSSEAQNTDGAGSSQNTGSQPVSADNDANNSSDENSSDQKNNEQNVSSEPQTPPTPMVALTFDDGPYSPVTDRIVAKLNEYGGKATFFVVGNRVSTYSDSLKAAYASGCEIGNHTWDHTTLTRLTPIEIMREIHDTENIVAYYTGTTPTIVRPVGGSHNEIVDASVGRPMITWSIDTLDWKSKNAQSVTEHVLNSVKDGDIILMHDLYPSTADACDTIIPELTARGYKLVTVSELAEARGISLEAGKTYSSFRP